MFPLALSETMQQIIVSAVVSIAALAIVRRFFNSRKPKSGSCSKCDTEI